MAQLRHDVSRFMDLDTEIVVVGPESQISFTAYWHAHKLTFIGLPDPKHCVMRLFGQEVNLFKLGRMPAQVLVDKTGVIRFVHYGRMMSDIPANDEILTLIEALSQEGGPEALENPC